MANRSLEEWLTVVVICVVILTIAYLVYRWYKNRIPANTYYIKLAGSYMQAGPDHCVIVQGTPADLKTNRSFMFTLDGEISTVTGFDNPTSITTQVGGIKAMLNGDADATQSRTLVYTKPDPSVAKFKLIPVGTQYHVQCIQNLFLAAGSAPPARALWAAPNLNQYCDFIPVKPVVKAANKPK